MSEGLKSRDAFPLSEGGYSEHQNFQGRVIMIEGQSFALECQQNEKPEEHVARLYEFLKKHSLSIHEALQRYPNISTHLFNAIPALVRTTKELREVSDPHNLEVGSYNRPRASEGNPQE